MKTAISKKEVSVLVLPGDIALKELKAEIQVIPITPDKSYSRTCEDDLKKRASVLNDSKEITILAGHGAVEAREELIGLVRKLKAPIVHGFDVGMKGLLGFFQATRP